MHIPYKPFFDRTLSRLVDQSDCMYVHNDFVRPGPHSYFIFVVDRDGLLSYRKHFTTFVKERKEECAYRTIPKSEKQEVKVVKISESMYPQLIKDKWKLNANIIYNEYLKDIPLIKFERLAKKE